MCILLRPRASSPSCSLFYGGWFGSSLKNFAFSNHSPCSRLGLELCPNFSTQSYLCYRILVCLSYVITGARTRDLIYDIRSLQEWDWVLQLRIQLSHCWQVIETDKGNATVIRYTQEYESVMNQMLSDQTRNQWNRRNPTSRCEKKINELVDKLREGKFVAEDKVWIHKAHNTITLECTG